MRKAIFILSFLATALFAQAQKTMDDFFNSQGLRDLLKCAHPSNTYRMGSYTPGQEFATAYFENEQGASTKLKIGLNLGQLYFSNIKVLYDDHNTLPFASFSAQSPFLMEVTKLVNPEEYKKMRRRMVLFLGVDPEHWTGTDWALFAMNLDYLSYMFPGGMNNGGGNGN